MNGYEIVSEALIFNQDDLFYKFDDWTSGKTKILFILGFSGSGKTTTTNELVKKYNAELVDLDNDLKLNQLWKQFCKDNNLTNSDVWSDRDKKLWKVTAYKYLVSRLRKTTKPTVWEGVDLYWTFSPKELSHFSMIIKGTSYLISTIRGHRRDKGSDRTLWWRFRMNKDFIKFQNRLVKYLKGKK